MKIVGDSASQWSKRGKMIELQELLLKLDQNWTTAEILTLDQ
jgi:hypothetical protein